MGFAFSITRVVNACVLLEFGEDAVLTDPYFEARWFMRLREPIGLTPADLPRLTAIIGGHGVLDHWQLTSLAGYPYKAQTPVIAATLAMRKKAEGAGFPRAEVLTWGARRLLSSRLELEVAPAQTAARIRVNNYVLSTERVRVFVGTEACDLEPVRRYRAEGPPVDVALLPIDASTVLGCKLVMSPADALEACRVLGARVLIPIHYALKSVPFLLQTSGSCEELVRLARDVPEVEVITLVPGRRWMYERTAA